MNSTEKELKLLEDDGKPLLSLKDLTETEVVLVGVLPLFLIGIGSLVFVFLLSQRLKAQKTGKDIGHPRIDHLAAKIKTGAISFLKAEYKYLTIWSAFWVIVLILLFTLKPSVDRWDGIRFAISFVIGAFLSGLSGWIGMNVATDGNVRTAAACHSGSLNDGLRVAFTGGAAMGFGVAGLASVGLTGTLLLMMIDRTSAQAVVYLRGFGFGASSIALFARVAGGIYTKAADVGADLVGKVEAGIDEDDPHNPAVIADNVGDNVGDVAGMGADLFESYCGSIIAAASLGTSSARFALPFWLCGAGLIGSFIGFFCVRTSEEGTGKGANLHTLMWALERGSYISKAIFLILAAVICILLFGPDSEMGWRIFVSVIIGMLTGIAIGKSTEIFTSFDYGPTKSIKDRGRTGPATVIIQGMGVGMISTVPPTLVLALAIVACAELAGAYGVAIAAVGMLTSVAIQLSTDAYGPIADNAGGLAEMGYLGESVRAKTDSLDALGNTTAAIGKGFATGSAVLTALSLLATYKDEVSRGGKSHDFDVSKPILLAGVLLGSMLPYLFSALTMMSVGKAAAEMIDEVRRQFYEVKNKKGRTLIEAIKLATEGTRLEGEDDVEPDSDRCIEISTRSSVKEMLAPGMFSVMTPLVVGFLAGPSGAMGLMVGCIGSATMLAILMGNAGGAWDNAKKLCEKIEREKPGPKKKSEQQKACIVGDTVGDPYKDTSGPSLDILLKLLSMVCLLVAPLIADKDQWEDWWIGLIPLIIGAICCAVLIHFDVLTWKDPLGGIAERVNSKENPTNLNATPAWMEPSVVKAQ